MPVGEVFLGAFLALLFDKLASPELRAIAGRWKVEQKMKKLARTLSKIQAVLNDAEERQIRDMAVQKWLDELKYIAYDVEDILDQFSTEALRWKLEVESQTGTMQVCRIFVPSSHAVSFRFGIGSKINKINNKLKRIVIERDVLGLREGVGGSFLGVTLRQPTSSLPDEACVYGREEDREKIIKLLLSDEPSFNNLFVIPIVGMAGLGKTTLAQLVYNDERVHHHFGLKAWAYVSENFDVLKLTKAILESAHGYSYNLNELESLQVKLKNIFSKKKFLLVLDDVWNENYNDMFALLTPFKCGTQGSKIIVTTRSNTISSRVGTVAAHQLKILSDEDCLSLFKQHAFVGGTTNENSKLEDIGKEIVKKCKGLPLAAKTLGSLFRSKPYENEWENIMKSEIWNIPEYKAGILPALRLSYHLLPPHLKRCFSYCSIFPKGHEFEKEKLVLLWMGEGLVQPKEGEQLEDTGGEYFHNLFNKSFFQRSSRDGSMFVMHDLMNDLAQSVSRGICFRLEDKLVGGHVENYLEKARHSSYLRGRYDRITKFETFYKAKYLRTFLPLPQQFTKYEYSYLPKQVLYDLFSKLRYLRVLCLSWYKITELPDSLGNLRNLRYLNLSNTPIERLPDSICSLYSLQTLILINCHNLSELPNDMGNLTNLRHLETFWLKKMPLCIGRLTSLQKLSIFVVGKGNITSGPTIKELRSLSQIGGNLSISYLQNVDNVTDVLEANLRDKQRLQKLKLEWRINNVQDERTDILDGLQPPINLKELIIESYRGYRFSNWIGDAMSLSNLVNLKLIDCKHCESLPPIGKLPSLKYLTISGMDGVETVGPELYGDGVVKAFPSLEIITFENMSLLKEWYGPYGVEIFPCLRELKIRNCHQLRQVPPCFPTLEKLEIEDCKTLLIFPSIVSTRDQCGPSTRAEEGSSSIVSTLGHSNQKDKEAIQHEHPSFVGKSKNENGILPSFAGKSKEKEGVSIIPCRREVTIKKCPSLRKLPHVFPPLEKLRIHKCCKLDELPMPLPSLGHLDLEECNEMILTSVVELYSLCSLRISLFPTVSLTWGFRRALTNLVELEISNFLELEVLGLRHLVSLRRLVIFECPKLLSLPQEDALPTSLHYLHLSYCHGLKKLPHMGLFTELRSLSIDSCSKIKCLPEGLYNLIALQHLEIRWCPSIMSFPETALPIKLQTLEIIECNNLKFLPEGLYNHMVLKYLTISGCTCLVSFPRGGLPTTLQKFKIMGCPNLESLPEGLNNLASLERFEIHGCPRLVSFPEGGLPFNTKSVEISECENLKSPSDWWGFQELVVHDCPRLIISFSEFEIHYTCLQSLSVKDCAKLALPQSGLKMLTSLRKLTIAGYLCLEPSPERLQLPTTLSYLGFIECYDLESLPEELQNLNSLDELEIIDCPKLASLPKMVLPATLSRLVILNCPLLKKYNQTKKGKDWAEIDNIPCLMIDNLQ